MSLSAASGLPLGIRYAIKAELLNGRSGRPFREALLRELRMLRHDIISLWASKGSDKPAVGLDHLPPLDKTPEEVEELKASIAVRSRREAEVAALKAVFGG